MLHDKPSTNIHLSGLLQSVIFAEGDSESRPLAQCWWGVLTGEGVGWDVLASGGSRVGACAVVMQVCV